MKDESVEAGFGFFGWLDYNNCTLRYERMMMML